MNKQTITWAWLDAVVLCWLIGEGCGQRNVVRIIGRLWCELLLTAQFKEMSHWMLHEWVRSE